MRAGAARVEHPHCGLDRELGDRAGPPHGPVREGLRAPRAALDPPRPLLREHAPRRDARGARQGVPDPGDAGRRPAAAGSPFAAVGLDGGCRGPGDRWMFAVLLAGLPLGLAVLEFCWLYPCLLLATGAFSGPVSPPLSAAAA